MWPNIQGDVWNVPSQNKEYATLGPSVSGCFDKGRSEAVGYATNYMDGIDGFVFKASKANATYGGNTVQSPALQALACISICHTLTPEGPVPEVLFRNTKTSFWRDQN